MDNSIRPKENQSAKKEKEPKDYSELENITDNKTQKEEDKDPTKYGDWQVNGRAIDF